MTSIHQVQRQFDQLKSVEDKEQIIELSFKLYTKEKKPDESFKQLKEAQKRIISLFFDFFRGVKVTRKSEDEWIKDHFKARAEVMSSLTDKVNKIYEVQSKKFLFTDPSSIKQLSKKGLSDRGSFLDAFNNIKRLKSFGWRINVTISNSNSFRILIPEIEFEMHLEDGSKYTFNIDIKVFQEVRKNIAFHIKKIMDNENVPLLK